MCLYVNNEATEKLKKRMKQNGEWLYLYKVVNLGNFLTKLQSCFNRDYHWDGGWNKAKGKLEKNIHKGYCGASDLISIEGGAIHVYTTRKKARRMRMWNTDSIIKVKCFLKDLIEAGDDKDACFKKVWLDKEEKNRTIKKLARIKALKFLG